MFDSDVEAYMTIDYSFWGIRGYDGRLIPNKWDLVINLAGIDSPDAPDQAKYQLELAATYQKISYWLDYFFSNVILVSADNTDLIDALDTIAVDNTCVTTPGEPTDDLLIKLIHAKISVLAGKHLLIGRLALKGTDSNSTFHFTNNSGGYNLPDVSYIGEKPAHKLPWWLRDDVDTYDMSLADCDDDDVAEIMESIDTKQILADIVEDINKTLGITESDNKHSGPAEVISINKKEEWIPKPV